MLLLRNRKKLFPDVAILSEDRYEIFINPADLILFQKPNYSFPASAKQLI